MMILPSGFFNAGKNKKDRPEKLSIRADRNYKAPEGYAMVGTRQVKRHMGNKGTPLTYNIYQRQKKQASQPRQAPPAPAATAPPPQAQAPQTLPVDNFPQPQGPSMEDIASQFASQIAQMQQGFMQSMQQQQQMFQQMQTSQTERMEALQNQMMQSQVQQQQRPEVAGVKMATGAAGTPMQIAKRGVTGAFGRKGMRIASLNV